MELHHRGRRHWMQLYTTCALRLEIFGNWPPLQGPLQPPDTFAVNLLPGSPQDPGTHCYPRPNLFQGAGPRGLFPELMGQ